MLKYDEAVRIGTLRFQAKRLAVDLIAEQLEKDYLAKRVVEQ